MTMPQQQTGFSLPSILQNIFALSQKNNGAAQTQDGQQNMLGFGINSNQLPGATQNSLGQISALSQLMGYDKNTMFGYGGNNQGDGTGRQLNTGVGTSNGQPMQQSQGQGQGDFWSRLWGLFGSNSGGQ